jgi:hypothetical protein
MSIEDCRIEYLGAIDKAHKIKNKKILKYIFETFLTMFNGEIDKEHFNIELEDKYIFFKIDPKNNKKIIFSIKVLKEDIPISYQFFNDHYLCRDNPTIVILDIKYCPENIDNSSLHFRRNDSIICNGFKNLCDYIYTLYNTISN